MAYTFYEQLTRYFPLLRISLRALGISEARIARQAGMHPTQFSRLMNHPSDIRVSTIERIERAVQDVQRGVNVPQA